MTASHDALAAAHGHARAFLDSLGQRPVAARLNHAELLHRFDTGMPDTGVDPVQVIDDLAAAAEGGLLGSTTGRFFAWVIGGALPAAVAADTLAVVWDQNAGMLSTSPAAAVAEEVAGNWIRDLLDMPAEASFAFTTGCQMAHFTGLAAARHGVLARHGWDVELAGLAGAPPVRVLVNADRHTSIDLAVRMLGLGTQSLVPVATDADGRMVPAALAEAQARHAGVPLIVCLNAADLNIGSFDDFETLVPMAKAANAWVHVDGAFGLWAKASPARRHLAAGVELADSWATDAHKWLNTPQDCGLAFVRDAAAHRAAMTITGSYLVVADGARDAIDWTPEWSRRARGFAVYAALRELGRDGLAAMIDRCCDHAAALAEGIGALDGAEQLSHPALNQALVRFLDPAGDHDRRTDAVIAAVNASGEAYVSGTTWQGKRAMRISVCNWRTNDADVARTIAAVQRALS